MYNDFFEFETDPFNVTPDPDFIFYSDQHKEVLAHMLYGVEERRGFIVVTGRVGSGKTTLCRAFLREIGDRTSTALILNSTMTAPELLESIAEDFGYELPEEARSKEVIDSLNDFLLSEFQEGRNACVIIDESQNLSPDALEQLRLLSNLETEKEKLLQIVLVGQPELGDLLDRPELRQLKQRVALRAHLTNLNEEETREYVRHRIEKASREAPVVHVEEEVFPRLYEVTEGNPRSINLLADRVLMAAYLDDSQVVTLEHLEQGVEDLSGTAPPGDEESVPVPDATARGTDSGGEDGEGVGGSGRTTELLLRGSSLLVGSASALVTLVLGIAVITWISWWNQPTVRTPPPEAIAPADTPPPAPGEPAVSPGRSGTVPSRNAISGTNPLGVESVEADTAGVPEHGYGARVLARYVSLYIGRRDLTPPSMNGIVAESHALSELVPAYLPGQLVDQQGGLGDLTRYGYPVLLWWAPDPDRGRYVLHDPATEELWDPLRGPRPATGDPIRTEFSGRGRILVPSGANLEPGETHVRGDRGIAVRWIQRLLNRTDGEDLPIVGRYGPRTVDVVTAFQASHKLETTGVAGPTTKLILLREAGVDFDWDQTDLNRFLDRLGGSHVAD